MKYMEGNLVGLSLEDVEEEEGGKVNFARFEICGFIGELFCGLFLDNV